MARSRRSPSSRIRAAECAGRASNAFRIVSIQRVLQVRVQHGRPLPATAVMTRLPIRNAWLTPCTRPLDELVDHPDDKVRVVEVEVVASSGGDLLLGRRLMTS